MRFLIVIMAIVFMPLGLYMEFVYPTNAIRAELEASGISDVKLEYRMFSGTFFTRCNHEHATVRPYTGIQNGHYVQGVACWAPFWGAAHWES